MFFVHMLSLAIILKIFIDKLVTWQAKNRNDTNNKTWSYCGRSFCCLFNFSILCCVDVTNVLCDNTINSVSCNSCKCGYTEWMMNNNNNSNDSNATRYEKMDSFIIRSHFHMFFSNLITRFQNLHSILAFVLLFFCCLSMLIVRMALLGKKSHSSHQMV